jgi:hypothetical protein
MILFNSLFIWEKYIEGGIKMLSLTEAEKGKIKEYKQKMIESTSIEEIQYYAALIHEIFDEAEKRRQSLVKNKKVVNLLKNRKWKISKKIASVI